MPDILPVSDFEAPSSMPPATQLYTAPSLPTTNAGAVEASESLNVLQVIARVRRRSKVTLEDELILV